MTDFRALRNRFPVLVERAYFATHNLGPVSIDTLAELDEYRRTIGLRNHALAVWLQRIDEIRGVFARLIGARDDEIALGPNATACQGNLVAALSPSPGRNRIVTIDLDFPSSRYLWHAQARRGFEIVTVPSRDGISMPVDDLVAAIDERVAVVAVPLVAYTNGALLAADRIIAAAHRAGAIVVLDAFQAVGIVPIDVRALGVDALVAGTQKWLGAPTTGLAFLYVRRELAETLEPAYPGWFGHEDTLSFGSAFQPAPGARRFEQGAPGVEAVYAARAGVQFVLDAGVSAMRARSLELAARMIEGADALGLALRTPRDPAERAGSVCLAVSDPSRTAAELRAAGIDCDTRPGTGVRFSLHPCNTEEDVSRALDHLARWR